jgi:hypothetical protein
MVNPDLLEILRCPACVREKEGHLKLVKESWLICDDCGRDKWQKTPDTSLPIPPPRPE